MNMVHWRDDSISFFWSERRLMLGPALKPVIKWHGDGSAWIFCPGCRKPHEIHPRTWNGSLILPTLKPDFTVFRGSDDICHFAITGGRIDFFSDSTHHLASREVLMVEWLEPSPGSADLTTYYNSP